MAKVTAEEFAEKYARRMKGAIPDIQRGIERVSEAPTKRAAAKKEKMRARVLEAIDTGRWEAGLNAVSLEAWKAEITEKGISRIPQGVDRATGKVADFARKLLPYQDALAKKIQTMPDLTLEDAVNRAAEWIRGMSKFRK